MRITIRQCVLVTTFWLACRVATAQPTAQIKLPVAPTSKEDTLWVFPHTHWEGAVFLTREQYLKMGFPHIIHALQLLKEYPDYTFVLDQVAYVRPFLERYPEHVEAFRKYVAEGRLQLVHGMNVMPDDNMPGGECLVRQIQYGKGYYRKALGIDVKTAWFIDTFGHHAQMPQILKLGGYEAFWFFRGVPNNRHPSEFLWEGIDGSRIPSVWLPHAYGIFWGAPGDLPNFEKFAKQRFDMLTLTSRGKDRAAPAGVDVCDPEDQLPMIVKKYQDSGHDLGFKVRFGVPSQFNAAVAGRAEHEIFKGELNPIFQGIYSSRIDLKQKMRSQERLLTEAEKFGVIAQWLGNPVDSDKLWKAWELTVFNQTHDLASGVMTDAVYQDVLSELSYSKRLGDGLVDSAWEHLAGVIDTRGDGVPLVVFNTMSWPRTDMVEASVSFLDAGVKGIAVTDSSGAAVPVQIVSAVRGRDGGIREAQIAFRARNISALGYAVYRAAGQATESAQVATFDELQNVGTLENEFYKLSVDRITGAITELLVKEGNWQAFSGPANVVARQEDRGDLWETYQGLNGGNGIATPKQQAVPRADKTTKLSTEFKAENSLLSRGPVFSEFNISHPLDDGKFATSVRLAAGSRRIEITTRLVNRSKLVRYQALFPTTIQNGRNVQAIPFGAIERPAGVEFPAQSWVDYGDGNKGVALLNIGLPGNLTADGTLILSLLRAHTIANYGPGGGFERGMSSDSGYQIGVERALQYSLVPHNGDWRDAGVYRDAMEFNHPLICRKAGTHAGMLPSQWGFLSVSAPNVVVSAVQPGNDSSVLVRVYEAAGRAANDVELVTAANIMSASETNLLQDHGVELKPEGKALRFSMTPYQIKTFSLKLELAR